MPLLLYGARQVGKTYILKEFGERYFQNMVYVNLETNPAVADYFSGDISPARLFRFLETVAHEEILPGKTLVVLDEVQCCERALTSLKYIAEQAPQIHVAAAGSLLGVAVRREQYAFPVGRVESMTLYPLDFEEFLWAVNEERLAAEIRRCFGGMEPMPEALHQRAIELYRYYLIVGGMPASANKFVETGKLIHSSDMQHEIMNNYVADMAKYTTPSDTVKIRACFNSIPAQLAKENTKFQYKVVQKGGSASLFGVSIDWLEQSGIVFKALKVDHGKVPVAVYADLSSFKLYMVDAGMLVTKAGMPQQTVLTGAESPFMGAVTENYVAQALASNGYPLYYWRSEDTAEVDFVLQIHGEIVPVEVKRGEHTRSRSLDVFRKKYQPAYAIRFSEKNFGRAGDLLLLPLYAAFCIG
ncbi:MAG TPA: ATPase [Clostridiales bacterium]|nr:ATPase [Clostridiales bacterium]